MKCLKTQKFISPYIDGKLSQRKKREVENHLEVCEKCRTEVEEIKRLRQLFVDAEKFEAPYGFHTRVMANINAAKIRKLPIISIPLRLAEAAIVILLAVVGIASGTFLVKGLTAERAGTEMASLHLDLFQSAPPGTLAGAYLAMMEDRNEK